MSPLHPQKHGVRRPLPFWMQERAPGLTQGYYDKFGWTFAPCDKLVPFRGPRPPHAGGAWSVLSHTNIGDDRSIYVIVGSRGCRHQLPEEKFAEIPGKHVTVHIRDGMRVAMLPAGGLFHEPVP